MNKLKLIFIILLVPTILNAQHFIGKVVDSKTLEPLGKVKIRVLNSHRGTKTTNNGIFRLKLNSNIEEVVISLEGYRSMILNISKKLKDPIVKLIKSPLNINEIVETPTKMETTLKNSPHLTSLILENEIKEVSPINIRDILNVYLSSVTTMSNTYEHNFILGGLKNNSLLVLIDGKRIDGDVNGSLDVDRVNIGNIEKVEIIKGGMSAIYGANALGGVVNIITKKSTDDVNINIGGHISTISEYNFNSNICVNRPMFRTVTSLIRNYSDGYKLSNYELGSEKFMNKKIVDRSLSDNFSQKVMWKFTKQIDAYGKIDIFEKIQYKPVGNSNFNQKYESQNFEFGTKYNISEKFFVDLTINHNHFKDFKKDYYDLLGNKKEDIINKNEHITNLYTKLYYGKLEGKKIIAGIDFCRDNIAETTYFRNSKTMQDFSFYGQIEAVAKDFLLTGGFRLNSNSQFGVNFSPIVSLKYNFRDMLNIRGTYTNGFKTPKLRQLFNNYVYNDIRYIENSDLKTQVSNYLSTSIEFYKPKFIISINGYLNIVNNFITLKEIELSDEDKDLSLKNKLKYSNISKANIKGIDLSLNYFHNKYLSLKGGFSYLDSNNELTNTKLEGTSNYVGNLALNFTLKMSSIYKHVFSLQGKYESPKYFKTVSSKGFMMWNFTWNQYLNLFDYKFDLSIGIKNLLDYKDNKLWGSYYSTIDPGRRMFARITINFTD